MRFIINPRSEIIIVSKQFYKLSSFGNCSTIRSYLAWSPMTIYHSEYHGPDVKARLLFCLEIICFCQPPVAHEISAGATKKPTPGEELHFFECDGKRNWKTIAEIIPTLVVLVFCFVCKVWVQVLGVIFKRLHSAFQTISVSFSFFVSWRILDSGEN